MVWNPPSRIGWLDRRASLCPFFVLPRNETFIPVSVTRAARPHVRPHAKLQEEQEQESSLYRSFLFPGRLRPLVAYQPLVSISICRYFSGRHLRAIWRACGIPLLKSEFRQDLFHYSYRGHQSYPAVHEVVLLHQPSFNIKLGWTVLDDFRFLCYSPLTLIVPLVFRH